jgi:hypothetical protein
MSLLLVCKNDKDMYNKTTDLLTRLCRLGIENNISISGQEVLNDCVIGMDGINRKLLVVKRGDLHNYYNWYIIDLDEIINCSVKKTYRSIMAGELKGRTIEEYLEQIDLRLELLNKKEPVEIPFYRYTNHQGTQINQLDRKAKNWQIMLSKMQKNRLKKIA